MITAASDACIKCLVTRSVHTKVVNQHQQKLELSFVPDRAVPPFTFDFPSKNFTSTCSSTLREYLDEALRTHASNQVKSLQKPAYSVMKTRQSATILSAYQQTHPTGTSPAALLDYTNHTACQRAKHVRKFTPCMTTINTDQSLTECRSCTLFL